MRDKAGLVWVYGPAPDAPGLAGGIAAHVRTLLKLIADDGRDARLVPMDRIVLPGLPRRAGVAVGLAACIARVALDPSARGAVVHVNTSIRPAWWPPRDLAFVEAATRRGLPVLLQVHGGRWSHVPGNRWEGAWRRMLGLATRIVCFPGPQEDELRDAGFGDKLDTVLNFVPTTPEPAPRPPGPPRFLFMGWLNDNKRVLPLIDAFGEALPRMPGARLTILGDGPLRDVVPVHASKPELKGSVSVLGQLRGEALWRAIDDADVFVLPSREEGFPISFLETAERGLAPIVTVRSAVPRLFSEGTDFLGVDPDDPRALVEALVALAADPARRATLGRAARAAVHARCTPQTAGRHYLDLYDALRR